MTLGGSGHAYGEASYWDNRYSQDPGPFDWYQKYVALAPLFDLYLQRRHRLLLVGCGNSALGEEMVNDGYEDIVNIDISSVVIEAMKEKYADCPEMKYFEMDVRDMTTFESGSFDTVIDKGTLDSLMCGSSAQQNSAKMLEEVNRILKDDGAYILITYGDPKYRLYLLKAMGWTVNLHVIGRPDRIPQVDPWELTKPIPMSEDGSLATTAVGSNPEIHYIYVCLKVSSFGIRLFFFPSGFLGWDPFLSLDLILSPEIYWRGGPVVRLDTEGKGKGLLHVGRREGGPAKLLCWDLFLSLDLSLCPEKYRRGSGPVGNRQRGQGEGLLQGRGRERGPARLLGWDLFLSLDLYSRSQPGNSDRVFGGNLVPELFVILFL
ncbi:unnamed protein product [Spirodela intermedia]|uniref:Methyltransferase type 11 domain-containing protein n=1 Tax=Spirodela intermedia TaxID=51605 RepID=A0A7I8KL83_SPIIN|nr:unnamed protein product [Spirodela intermedia]